MDLFVCLEAMEQSPGRTGETKSMAMKMGRSRAHKECTFKLHPNIISTSEALLLILLSTPSVQVCVLCIGNGPPIR